MLRSARIPDVLDRICDGNMILQSLLVTADGELLGCSSSSNVKTSANFGTLVGDIATDYQRLGEEYAAVDEQNKNPSHLQCLLLEMDLGIVAVTACSGIDCFVVAVASRETPPGLVKARLQALSVHVQEALQTLTETA